MTRETHQSRQRPGIVTAMLVAMLLACALPGSGGPALAEEAPAPGRDDAVWDDTAFDAAAWDEGAWEQSASPTLADLARDDAAGGLPPVVELRLRAAPVGLAVEVADGVHLGAAGDYDHRTREAVGLFALRLSL